MEGWVVGQAIGIDIGGTGIKGAPVDLAAGQLAAERVRLPTPSPATPEAVAGVVVKVLEQVEGAGGKGAGGTGAPVGLTLPAVVREGVVRTAAHIDPNWVGTDAVARFRQATGRPVAVLNDADAAGVAEMRFGAGKGRTGVVVMLTLGTGIGSALFTDGALVPNTEFGHLHLHHGAAEEWAADSVREREQLSWHEYAHRLQRYLQLVQRLLWPELIIIGGGVSKHADRFLPRVQLDTEVVPARLHNNAGIVGAALAAPRD